MVSPPLPMEKPSAPQDPQEGREAPSSPTKAWHTGPDGALDSAVPSVVWGLKQHL